MSKAADRTGGEGSVWADTRLRWGQGGGLCEGAVQSSLTRGHLTACSRPATSPCPSSALAGQPRRAQSEGTPTGSPSTAGPTVHSAATWRRGSEPLTEPRGLPEDADAPRGGGGKGREAIVCVASTMQTPGTRAAFHVSHEPGCASRPRTSCLGAAPTVGPSGGSLINVFGDQNLTVKQLKEQNALLRFMGLTETLLKATAETIF